MYTSKVDENAQEHYLFLYLLHSFESAALIGLGKLPGPTGECKLELETASFSIDMLDMIERRMRGNLCEEESQYLKRILGDLKLNYLTEKEKLERQSEEGGQGEKVEGAKTV
jgi:hypothetical protein